ncbi:Uncharacterised protein [Brevundimonas vancanneytii]|uniref:Uncharacterized protein n=1 Tax=Brevundimonas vancanneytii TaxID=1325724 RepID=A0A4P1K9J5_9CAUL|nr:Uncharacterised protein [Brevundimonas vancanneytii]
MKPLSFKRHRFPGEVIRHAVWLYFRFNLSFRDVEELMAQRGIDVSYENDPVLDDQVRASDCTAAEETESAPDRPLAS